MRNQNNPEAVVRLEGLQQSNLRALGMVDPEVLDVEVDPIGTGETEQLRLPLDVQELEVDLTLLQELLRKRLDIQFLKDRENSRLNGGVAENLREQTPRSLL